VNGPVEVQIKCICPGSPHEQDTIYLRPKLGLSGGVALQSLLLRMIKEAPDTGIDSDLLGGIMSEGYLVSGVVAWTLLDENGQPVPITPQNINDQLLLDFQIAEPISSIADDLYYEPVLAPLLKRLRASLQTSPTKGSTSATKRSRTRKASQPSRSIRRSSKRPTPLKPSSTSTTQTGSTGKTLVALAGGSTG
jgi:hypothetical protein